MDANLGLEGIVFIPDTFLLSKRFYDDSRGKLYDPNDYPDHGNGLFFLGLEGKYIIEEKISAVGRYSIVSRNVNRRRITVHSPFRR